MALAGARSRLVGALGLLATNTFSDTPIPFPLSVVNVPVVGAIARWGLFSKPSLSVMLRQGVGRGSTPPDSEAHLGDGGQQRSIATIFAGSLTRLAELYEPVEAALGRLDLPAFVGWGDHDPFFAIVQGERTAAALGTQLRIYEGAGHFLPHERPIELAADIVALVDHRRSSI